VRDSDRQSFIRIMNQLKSLKEQQRLLRHPIYELVANVPAQEALGALEQGGPSSPCSRNRGRQTREAPTTRDDAPRAKRRAAPATGEVAAGAAEPEAAARVFDLGDHNIVAQGGDESWGVIGQTIRLHNSFWGWDDGAYSECRVIAYAGAYTFAAGAHSRHTYVIECEGQYYPATHGTIADALTDATVKRRVRKAGPPRLL